MLLGFELHMHKYSMLANTLTSKWVESSPHSTNLINYEGKHLVWLYFYFNLWSFKTLCLFACITGFNSYCTLSQVRGFTVTSECSAKHLPITIITPEQRRKFHHILHLMGYWIVDNNPCVEFLHCWFEDVCKVLNFQICSFFVANSRF